MNETIFNDLKEGSTEQDVLFLADRIGLNIDKLKKDADFKKTRKQLINDVNEANKLEITATPTYIIGMEKHIGLMSYPDLKAKVIKAGGKREK